MTTRAVLFDLDDTLVAFDAVTEQSWSQVCLEYHRAGHQVDPGVLAARIRESSDWYWGDAHRHRWGRANILEARREVVSRAFAAVDLPKADAIALADRYSRVRLTNMYVFEGVHPLLERLRTDGRSLALVTNGDSVGQRAKIRRFGLAEYFSTILIEGELGFGKPDPRVYETALARLGTTPSQARMVGDNLAWDIEAPQKAGIAAIWIDRNGAGLPPNSEVSPWRTIRTISELPRILGLEGSQ